MAIPQTFDQLVQIYYNTVTTLNPNLTPSIQGSDLYFKANATAQVAANAIQDSQLLLNNIFPASSTGSFLDKFAGSLGMTPRQPALPSQGNATTLVANSGTTAAAAFVIPVNTQLTSSTTNQVYNVTEAVSVANGATLANVIIPIQSVNLGAGTNSPPDDTLTFVTPFVVPTTMQTIVSASVSSSGMTVGSDIESDNTLALRIFTFMINPRGGGSSGDYISWCFLGNANVTQATVLTTSQSNNGLLFPIIFEGSPNSDFYIDGNSANDYMETPAPINRTAPSADITAVQTYINGVRPVNDNPNVLTVATYELQDIDPVFGDDSYFDVNVVLSPGLTLTTNILISNGTYLTVSELIQREFRRAILQTPVQGTTVTIDDIEGQYIIVSDIERVVLQGLANSQAYQGNYASLLVSLEIAYHAQGDIESTYFVPVPSLQLGNMFVLVDGAQQAYLVYDIDTTILHIAEV